jgi:DNA polymerase III epsilon subunit-like protein
MKKNKYRILWFDTETSGFDTFRNDVLTGFFFVEECGKVIDFLDMRVQPYNWNGLTKSAEEIHGLTSVDIAKFEKPNIFFKNKFIPFLKENFNGNKFICAGHNIKFDIGFINSYWAKSKAYNSGINFITSEEINNFSNLNKWINDETLDTMTMAKFCQKNNLTEFKLDGGKRSVKLEVICKSLGIKYDSHDSKDDVIATKQVADSLYKIISNNKFKLELFKTEHPFLYELFSDKHVMEFTK